MLNDCVEIASSGPLTFYLENSAAKSDEKSFDYKIELATENVAIETRQTTNGAIEKADFSEVGTWCRYITSDKLEVVIQTTNVSKLGDSKFGYVYFYVKNPATGASTTFVKESDAEAGFVIKPKSDDIPSLASLMTYTTKPGGEAISGYASSCEAKMTAGDRAKVNKGTISCENLRTWKLGTPTAEDEPLGKFVNIKANWTCENYK